MIQYTDDPVADFRAWDRAQARWESDQTKCDECGEIPQGDYYYDIDGIIICERCLQTFRKPVEG